MGAIAFFSRMLRKQSRPCFITAWGAPTREDLKKFRHPRESGNDDQRPIVQTFPRAEPV
jgi:hypothetical protein